MNFQSISSHYRTRKKMEMSKDEEYNPILQDSNENGLRFVCGCFETNGDGFGWSM